MNKQSKKNADNLPKMSYKEANKNRKKEIYLFIIIFSLLEICITLNASMCNSFEHFYCINRLA